MRTSRRKFIQQTALFSSVFTLGFDWFAAEGSKMVSVNDTSLLGRWNAYLKIDSSGKIILYSPNPEIGQGIKTAFPIVVAEEFDVDWKDVEVLQADLDTKQFDRQLTGGSGALKHSWDRLRMAGATARQMFLQAAAEKWNVNVSNCSTQKGWVLGPNNLKIKYTEIIDAASKQKVPDKISFKNRKEYHLIGSFVKGVDNPGVLVGKPMYGIDYQKEGMVVAQIVRPPAFGATLKSFDASEVEKMPGIIEVKSFKNKVAIVGRTTWEIMQARNKLVCEYENPAIPESNKTHQKWFDEGKLTDKVQVLRKDGDVNLAFSKASKIIVAQYECPFIPHNSMEPMNFFADVQKNAVHLAGPTQVPQSAQKAVASLLGISEDNITVEITKIGGGFGRRLNNDYALEAAELSSIIQKPVKVLWTREDDLRGGIYRPSVRYYFKAGLDANGEVIAYHVRGVGLNAGNSVRQDNFPVGAIDNVLIENVEQKSAITTGPWRAPITNFLGYAEQAFLDEVAEKSGKDPVEMRLKWLDKVISKPVGKISYEPLRFKEVIQQVVKKANWKKKLDVAQGFSVYFSHNSYVGQIAEAKMVNGKPIIQKVYAVTDCGEVINKSGAVNQITGAIVDGFGHAMFGKLDFREGEPLQHNFNDYRMIRGNEIPEVDVSFVDNGISPTGLGEPALPPTGGAIANAIAALQGKRLYRQPFNLI